MPVSGEVMYSDEWMRRNGTNVPFMFRELCRDICKDHGLGNDMDMEMMWLTIQHHMRRIYNDAWDNGYDNWEGIRYDDSFPINQEDVEDLE